MFFGGSALDASGPKAWLYQAEKRLAEAKADLKDAEREVERAKLAVKRHDNPQSSIFSI